MTSTMAAATGSGASMETNVVTSGTSISCASANASARRRAVDEREAAVGRPPDDSCRAGEVAERGATATSALRSKAAGEAGDVVADAPVGQRRA